MIDVKQAAESASVFFYDLYRDKGASGVRLEEVELVEDDKFWLITLSFLLPQAIGMIPLKPSREYKTFKVDAQTGQVISMKIRELEYGIS